MKKITTHTIREMKGAAKIAALTCYDYSTAKIMDELCCDMLLVGDSLGNVVLGYDSTTRVTVDDMLHHTKAVSRGTHTALVITDMPFLSYHTGVHDAIKNAGLFISEGGANGVKLEGGREIAATVESLVTAGIPVLGHLGLLPQSINQIGGFFTQGKTGEQAERLLSDAKALEEAGVFAVVLECIPHEVAKAVTEAISIPTIGIGAGPHCDGQILVSHDMLGLFSGHVPSFVKQYANLRAGMESGIKQYIDEVRGGVFPE